MKLKELCRVLNLHENTIRYYLKELDITVKRDSNNNRIFDTELVEILKKAKFYIHNEGTVSKAKILLAEEIGGYNGATINEPRIEIIQEPEPQENFDLILKPLNDRVIKLESMNSDLLQENKELIRDNATLSERVKGKEEIINFQYYRITELEARLNKKWWKIWA
jgi:DNA-binding transcriptional MerR regulator